MPDIPARPGDWDDLQLKMLRLWLCPGSLDGTASLEREFEGHMLYRLMAVFGDDWPALSHDDGKLLFETDPHQIKALKDWKKKADHGAVAGELLLTVLRIAHADSLPASVEKAWPLVSEKLKAFSHPHSRPTIMANWSKYKSVSHFHAATRAQPARLWAMRRKLLELSNWSKRIGKISKQLKPNKKALRQLLRKGERLGVELERTFNEQVPALMAVAERIRELGQSYFAPSQKAISKPTLDPQKMWTISRKDFDLPAIKLKLAPLTKAERAILRKRKLSKAVLDS